jgi:DNA-binding response OmpR family regulator
MSKTILIIEDDPDILDMMAYILRDEGYEVLPFLDCLPLQEILPLNPGLILMDNRLTAGSGKDACKKLKLDATTAHIPIILVSANRDLEQLTFESHADGFMAKPFDIDELVAIAKRHYLVS